jgi:sporulation protein YlmC with PRC-barrel domain
VILMSQLLGLAVRDEAGESLGRVHDIRVRRRGEHFEVEGLLVGAGGIAARLGLRARGVIDWADVRAVEQDALVVSSGRRPRPADDPEDPAGSR